MTSPRSLYRASMVAALAAAALSSPAIAQRGAPPRPAMLAQPPYSFPPVVSRTLSNGIPVAIVVNHGSPIVTVRVMVDSGPFVDPVGKAGLFSLMVQMLAAGTTSRSADQLTARFHAMGSTVTATTTAVGIGFTTITRNVDESVVLLGDMVSNPSFPTAALARAQVTRIAALRAMAQQSSLMGPQLFRSIAFGADHPYARRPDSASLAAITRDDLVAIHREYVRPENLSLVVVGDVEPSAIVARLEHAFGGLAGGGTKVTHDVPPPKPAAPTTIYLYDAPGDSVYLYTGHLLPPKSSPDFFAVETLNTLLGGVPATSRLAAVLRTERGFAYIANSVAWGPPPYPATLVTAGIVAPAHADSAVMEWMRVLRGFVDRAPSDEEMTFARGNRVGSVAIRLQTTNEMARQIGDLVGRGLPVDFMAAYGAGMARVTPADVLAAGRAYVDPDHLIVIVIGPRAKVEAGLRAANIAPVVVVDRNGHPIG